MRRFEVGKRYNEDSAIAYEIIARTPKTITYQAIQHTGRYNERKTEPKKTKLHDWKTREVFFAEGEYLVEA